MKIAHVCSCPGHHLVVTATSSVRGSDHRTGPEEPQNSWHWVMMFALTTLGE